MVTHQLRHGNITEALQLLSTVTDEDVQSDCQAAILQPFLDVGDIEQVSELITTYNIGPDVIKNIISLYIQKRRPERVLTMPDHLRSFPLYEASFRIQLVASLAACKRYNQAMEYAETLHRITDKQNAYRKSIIQLLEKEVAPRILFTFVDRFPMRSACDYLRIEMIIGCISAYSKQDNKEGLEILFPLARRRSEKALVGRELVKCFGKRGDLDKASYWLEQIPPEMLETTLAPQIQKFWIHVHTNRHTKAHWIATECPNLALSDELVSELRQIVEFRTNPVLWLELNL